MNQLGPGVATLEHEQTGRTDPDAVDATLAASGDASAFERLYRTHVPRVYGLIRRMLNDDDVDEVAQDIFVRAWQKLGTFRGEAAFGTWLHRLAINLMRSLAGRLHEGDVFGEMSCLRKLPATATVTVDNLSPANPAS